MILSNRVKLLGTIATLVSPVVAVAADECTANLGCVNDVSDLGDGATSAGYHSEAAGDHSVAIGGMSIAEGNYVTVVGYENITEEADYLAVLGFGNEIYGDYSTIIGCFHEDLDEYAYRTAVGYSTVPSHDYAVAIGYGSSASAMYAVAMGEADARTYAALSIGRGNVRFGTSGSWIPDDPLFEIGNRSPAAGSDSNAFTVLKKGYTGIRTATPAYPLQIIYISGDDAAPDSGGSVVIGSTNGQNLALDRNEIMARNNGGTSPLYLQNNGGNLYVGGQLYQSSDARLKDDIRDLSYGLEEVMRLRPVSFYWKAGDHTQRSLGFVAQEVADVIRELVEEQGDDKGTLSVDYTGLTAVLIHAVKELKGTDGLLGDRAGARHDTLTAETDRLDAAIEAHVDHLADQDRELDALAASLAEQQRLVAGFLEAQSHGTYASNTP